MAPVMAIGACLWMDSMRLVKRIEPCRLPPPYVVE